PAVVQPGQDVLAVGRARRHGAADEICSRSAGPAKLRAHERRAAQRLVEPLRGQPQDVTFGHLTLPSWWTQGATVTRQGRTREVPDGSARTFRTSLGPCLPLHQNLALPRWLVAACAPSDGSVRWRSARWSP